MKSRASKAASGKAVMPCVSKSFRQNGEHGIVGEMHPLVLALVLRGDEDGVHLAPARAARGDVDVVSHADIHVHVGALLAEALDDARQPMHGDAGIGADADDLRARGGDLLDHAVQAGVGLQKFRARRARCARPPPP